MKKILLGLCVLSALSTSAFAALHNIDKGGTVFLPVTGNIIIKNAPVVQGNKIAIYKDGADANGQDGLNFNINVQANTGIDQTLTRNSYWIKNVAANGQTEQEIRQSTDYVQKAKIQVGYLPGANPNTASMSFVGLTGPAYWTMSTAYPQNTAAGTLRLNAAYDDASHKLNVFMSGNVGASGTLSMNGKFGIKVVQ